MERRRTHSVKRLAAVITVCLAALMLTGCGASLTVYDYTSGGVRYNVYELSIDSDVVEKMESTATTDSNGEKYTVESYFYQLFTGFGYELEDASKTDKAYTVRYRKAVGEASELDSVGHKVKFETTYTENPFVRTYNAVSENPFNGVREVYDGIEPLQSSTVLAQIKNGIIARNDVGEYITVFPSIDGAFPYLKGADLDGLLLNYVRPGSSRMKSSGSVVETGDKTSNFVFGRYFDRSEAYMEFEYERPVPYGWYMVAVLAGLATLGVILLATRARKNKNKPTLLDRFPYNPEEYRDYDSNLPSKL